MLKKKCFAIIGLTLIGICVVKAEEISLIDFASKAVVSRLKINGNSDVQYKIIDTQKGKVLEVTCTPGKNAYPGVVIKPEKENWDLSKFGRVAVDITNLSDKKIVLTLRVDNPGNWKSNPWNAENTAIYPNKTKTAKVTFGYSWGKKAFSLNPAKVSAILIFTRKPKKELKFRISNLRAIDKPGVKPAGGIEKLKPKGGRIVNFKTYPKNQIDDRGAEATCSKTQAIIKFPADSKNKWPGTFFKAPEGMIWDLSDYNQVVFTLKNPGTKAIRAMCRVDNKNANGTLNCATGIETIAPGAEKKIVIPFVTDKIWDGNGPRHKTGFVFDSSKVVGVLVFTEKKPGSPEEKLILKSVKASVAPIPKMPAWLGKKPPVSGNWKVTFEDNFNGDKIDETKWVIPNKVKADDVHPMEVEGAKSWWGRDNSLSSKNIYVENGLMKIKCELSAKSKIDNPNNKKTKYITSLARTFGTFAQKYGYFESRMKLPKALGMWPAFWTMPDRGKQAGIWWKRQYTTNGGMEFDIMEYLGRYGPYKYNIAMHWDGYKKDHKSTGTEGIYFHTDKEGFFTSGLLWEPGKATFYVNGRVVGVYKTDRICNVPSYLMFTMPVGGWGTNGIVDDAKLPAYFEIDYVRVWQKDEWKDK